MPPVDGWAGLAPLDMDERRIAAFVPNRATWDEMAGVVIGLEVGELPPLPDPMPKYWRIT